MKEIKGHIYKDQDGKCLFPDQVNIWSKPNWDNMPDFFKRLNNIEDDRSFIILAASVLEMRVEMFLKSAIPNSNAIINDRTSFAKKLELVRAFNYIPTHFIDIADLLRSIRNDFAHDYSIDSFDDAVKIEKLPGRLIKMDKMWSLYKSDMIYWKKDRPIRLQYKDLWRICIEGFKVYQLNVELFRQETEKPEFIDGLMKLSDELREKREVNEKEKVFKIMTSRTKKNKNLP